MARHTRLNAIIKDTTPHVCRLALQSFGAEEGRPTIGYVYLLAVGITTLFQATLASYAQRHWQTASARSFVWLTIASLQITFSFLAQSIVPLNDSFFWVRLRFLGLTYGPVIFLLFVLDFTQQRRGLTPAGLTILSVIPTITTLIIWLFPSHFFADWTPVHLDGINTGRVEFTAWYSIHLVYSLGVGIASAAILIRYAIFVDSSKRGTVAWFVLGLIISSFFMAAPIYVGTPPGFRLTPLGLGAQSLLMAWALLRYDAFRVSGFAYDLLFQSMKDASFVVDNRNNIVQVNPAAEELLKQSNNELIGKDAMTALPALKQQIALAVYPQRGAYEIELKSGEATHTFDVQILPVKQGNDKLGSLIVLRDITDRKRAEQERIQLGIEQQRSLALHQFIDDSTHDLMTPLSIVNTSLYILQKAQDEATRAEYLSRIQAQVFRLQDMFQDMLLMSQLDWATDADQDYKDFYIGSMFLILEERYKLKAEERGLTMTFIPHTSVTRMPLDEDELSIVLSKLIDNAITYIPAGGTIRVVSTATESQTSISVSDNGPGITRADLMHIFDRFYRAQAHRPTNSGAGLGLSIARRIVELHGGQIEVKSVVGEGSTFTVSFPMHKGGTVVTTASAEPSSLQAP